jgi:hypothetical protein
MFVLRVVHFTWIRGCYNETDIQDPSSGKVGLRKVLSAAGGAQCAFGFRTESHRIVIYGDLDPKSNTTVRMAGSRSRELEGELYSVWRRSRMEIEDML